jgi:flagellar export protein FliJ
MKGDIDMKTKFSQIVKVKQRKVDEIENELMDVRFQKRKTLSMIEDILKEIEGLKTPQSGSFAEINLSHSYLKNLSNQKKEKEKEILQLDKQIEGIKELYKEANIEFEKIKYLEDLEIEKKLQELKVQESKDMDEIANLLHAKKKSKVA